jgi:hypothetical protein
MNDNAPIDHIDKVIESLRSLGWQHQQCHLYDCFAMEALGVLLKANKGALLKIDIEIQMPPHKTNWKKTFVKVILPTINVGATHYEGDDHGCK